MDYRGPKKKRRPTTAKGSKGLRNDGKPDRRLKKNNKTKEELNAPIIGDDWVPAGKTEQAAKAIRSFLNGKILCIDPSSGSEHSVPGFAVFRNQVLTEVGSLEISRTKSAPERLKELARALAHHFDEEFDLLIIEYVPPFMSKAGSGGFRTQSVVNLHRAIGVSMACTNWRAIIQVPPMSWRKWVENNVGAIGSTYKKRDDRDALAMGLTVFELARMDVFNYDDAVAFLRGEVKHVDDDAEGEEEPDL
jgi:hypothetical protein